MVATNRGKSAPALVSISSGCSFLKGAKMLAFCKKFLRDEDGATAIEYGLLAALIAVVIATGAALVGTNLSAMFTNIASDLPTT